MIFFVNNAPGVYLWHNWNPDKVNAKRAGSSAAPLNFYCKPGRAKHSNLRLIFQDNFFLDQTRPTGLLSAHAKTNQHENSTD